jgi:hypothetical protein
LSSLALFLHHAHGVRGIDNAAVTANTPGLESPVVAENSPPIIAIAANADVQIGHAFDYLPSAQDADHDVLKFTAVNLPPWANIDAATGKISGTPGPDDEGLYESITITVADATHEVVTAPFSIVVNPAVNLAAEQATNPVAIAGSEVGTGIASLRWEVPPSKVSGEPLDDLAGYRILYGRNSDDLDQSVLITDPATTSYQFSQLTSGTWYFEVVAVSSNGFEGPPTTLASKSI